MNIRLIAVIAVLFSFSSCMEKDKPMVLPEASDATSVTLNLGGDYSTQFYYNFENQEVVHSSRVDSWDLAFDNTKDGFAVTLNGGSGMALVTSTKTNFGDVSSHDCDGQVWLQDDPNGNAAETAIGEWNKDAISKSKIHIIRLDATNDKLVTLRLNNVTDSYYEFEIGKPGDSQTSHCKVYKDATRTYSYYDLEKRETIYDVEPLKESWDILFTRYGFTFYDQSPALPYIVTGVLSNSATQVFKDSVTLFDDIDATFIDKGIFSYNRDIIGYDWKTYDFDNGMYHINQEYMYIIRTRNDKVYKMSFLHFYDDNGVKGSPNFQFKQIQ